MSQKKASKEPVKDTPMEETRTNVANASEDGSLVFGMKNYGILIVGAVMVGLGYFLMTGGAPEDPTIFNAEEKYSSVRVTFSVLLIVLGLLSMIPAIMLKK